MHPIKLHALSLPRQLVSGLHCARRAIQRHRARTALQHHRDQAAQLRDHADAIRTAHEWHQQQERAAADRLASLAPRRHATHTPCDDGTGHLDMDGTLAPLGLLIVLCCGSLTAAGLWHLAALLLG